MLCVAVTLSVLAHFEPWVSPDFWPILWWFCDFKVTSAHKTPFYHATDWNMFNLVYYDLSVNYTMLKACHMLPWHSVQPWEVRKNHCYGLFLYLLFYYVIQKREVSSHTASGSQYRALKQLHNEKFPLIIDPTGNSCSFPCPLICFLYVLGISFVQCLG